MRGRERGRRQWMQGARGGRKRKRMGEEAIDVRDNGWREGKEAMGARGGRKERREGERQ
jgi:hypothetical protein